MKQVVLLMLISCSAIAGYAQTKAVQTAKIKTPTVVCEKCKDRIETYLKRYNGITAINVNYRSKETTVKYLTDRINIEEIKTAIANAGYDADDVPANPDSYTRLPVCCKKPEDGGPAKKH
jgi:mercuric ion binding protein